MMTTTDNHSNRSCCICNKTGRNFTCNECQRSFCVAHVYTHREDLSRQMNTIGQECEVLKHEINEKNINKMLLTQIDNWESEFVEKIQDIARKVRIDVERRSDTMTKQLSNSMQQLFDELLSCEQTNEYTEEDLDRWTKQLQSTRKELKNPFGVGLFEEISTFLHSLKNRDVDDEQTEKENSNSPVVIRSKIQPTKVVKRDIGSPSRHPIFASSHIHLQSGTYPCKLFGLNEVVDSPVSALFLYLMNLCPMDKNGPMSGQCDRETTQMEQFLSKAFGFKNIPDRYVVPGVRAFLIGKPPHMMVPHTPIHFPDDKTNSFMMTAAEIVEWQRSFKVYADKDIKGMTKEFLCRALQGQSNNGEEAFRMKFVVRISTCPILMEFDAKNISRTIKENWPNKIKLVSVTGIDFAGRIHDISDILYYISNWKDVFDIDRKSRMPLVRNGRDFCLNVSRLPTELREQRLQDSLMRMARLRLRACDAEGIQIVVETGIGLGVFSGQYIGIDGTVRAHSAKAIRTVLEEDGPSYKNIRAVIFALPIFAKSGAGERVPDTYDDFVGEFHKSNYTGPIPVMIADQDMHRLTVAIAREGFTVSELNPADSHGVFGEYWQNRGPAVEEKLALTTVGLLVQHHLINPQVLDQSNYQLVEINTGEILDCAATIAHDNK